VQWLGARMIDWFPRGAWRTDAKSLHITLGVVIGIILVARITWWLTQGRRLPPADKGVLQIIAKLIHFGLYAALAAMVLIGLVLVWAQGDNIFFLLKIPAFDIHGCRSARFGAGDSRNNRLDYRRRRWYPCLSRAVASLRLSRSGLKQDDPANVPEVRKHVPCAKIKISLGAVSYLAKSWRNGFCTGGRSCPSGRN